MKKPQGQELTERDLQMLERSWIDRELAERAGLVRVDSVEGGRLVGRNGRGDYSGIVFPYLSLDGSSVREYRLRRDKPDLEQQADGSIKAKGKYLAPPGRGNMFYVPPGVDGAWLSDVQLPACFVEGEKKTLALWRLALHETTEPRFLPLGLPGVWNWRGVVGKTADESGTRRDVKGVIPDFDRVTWNGRRVHIIFDTNVVSNENVRIARRELGKELARRGAWIHFTNLPQIDGVNGVDDLLAKVGPQEVLDLILSTLPENSPKKSKRQANTDRTPAQWFAKKFPLLADRYGDAILEQVDKYGVTSAQDFNEDFLAATLGTEGIPEAPTVFVPTEQKFYTYVPDEGIYVFQREPVLLARLSQMLLECARDSKSKDCETQTLEFSFRNYAKLAGALRKGRGILEVNHDFFSTELTEFIPCANGMLDLSDGKLLPFSPSYRRRNKLAVRFDPDAKCPIFLETLMKPALEPDDLDLIQRWCGLALIGENLAQVLLILIGFAGTGKGCFVRVLNGIIGQINLASLRPQLLGERFELGRFLGRTLLYGADVPENFLNQRGASVLKSLTGYDPMTLEFKNSNESPFIICRFNVIVTCNSRLSVRLEGDTDAWRRRLVIVDYHKPKPAKVIADLDQQILSNEASGVLNWMLEGLAKLREDDWQLRLNEKQQARVDNLLLESDGHSLFVKEELTRSKDGSLTVQECFAAYADYCTERGWSILSRNKFGQVIGDIVARQHGLTVRHDIPDANGKAQRGWRGLSLRSKNQVTETSAQRFMDEVYFPPGIPDAEIEAISAKALETT